MNKWIRWQGVVPFAVITLGLAVFFLFYVDTAVSHLIESTGSSLVGAKVETRDVDVHLSPLGVEVRGLQVTNPAEPMQNAVEVDRIAFGIEGGQLLMGKVIIDEMNMDGVRFDTPRKRSGALPKQVEEAKPKDDSSWFDMPSLDLPDAKTVVAGEKLKTDALAQSLQAAVKEAQTHWDQLQGSIPNEQRVASYQTRLQQIQQTDTRDLQKVAAAIQQLQALQKDLQGDLRAIETARTRVNQDSTALNLQYQALLKAPAADQKALMEKYAPNAQGVSNLSGMLFGPQAADWSQQGLYWYERLAPMLASKDQAPERERLQGVDVRFRERQPSPDFLIHRIRASVTTGAGDFGGEVLDVTHQPEVIGRPMRFQFSGRKMTGMEALDLHGNFNHIDPHHAVDSVDMTLTRYRIAERDLSQQPGLRLHMSSAISDTRFHANRINGQLDGKLNIHIQEIQYANQAGSGEFQQVLVNAFNKVNDFNVDARIEGTLGQPKLKLSSDLDTRLNREIQAAFDARIQAYRADLARQIEQATAEPIRQAQAQLQGWQQGVETRLAAAEQQLAQQKAALDNQRQQYQAQLEREKQKAQQQLQQQLNHKAQDLLKQLQR